MQQDDSGMPGIRAQESEEQRSRSGSSRTGNVENWGGVSGSTLNSGIISNGKHRGDNVIGNKITNIIKKPAAIWVIVMVAVVGILTVILVRSNSTSATQQQPLVQNPPAVLPLATVTQAAAPSRIAGRVDKNSTCADFLQLPQEQQLPTINRVAVSVGNQGAIGSPIFEGQVDDACIGNPVANFGKTVYSQPGF